LTQRKVVAIPKSVRPERMAESTSTFDFTLTDQMTRIAALNTGATCSSTTATTMVAAIGALPSTTEGPRRPKTRPPV
jgi:diketogulonate reductase-like aldo/keto reductase